MIMNQFKKCKVIMLPTKKGAFYELKAKPNYPIQEVKSELTLKCPYNNDKLSIRFDRHLYITSDEEIKEGDWYINLNTNKIDICNHHDESISINKFANNYCIKIIATTDTSLGWSNIGRDESGTAIGNCHKGNGMIIKPLLPQPSQQFIEKYIEEYNKGNVITDVLVEYEIETNALFKVYESDPIKLKVNPKDNTITIKKVKDSYSREEVRKLCIDAFISGTVARNKIGTIKDSEIELKNMNIWLAENL